MRKLFWIFFLSASALFGQSATFVKIDTTTGINPSGIYGGDGTLVAPGGNGSSSSGTTGITTSTLPSYATTTGVGAGTCNWTWRGYGSFPVVASGQIPTWFGCAGMNSSFTVDVNLTDGNPHQVAVFAIDAPSQGRTENLAVLNGSSVLDSETVSAYTRGKWVVWTITGHVTIQATGSTGNNPVITAIYFGGAAAPPNPGNPQVTLNWTPSTTSGSAYVIYRTTGATACTTSGTVLATVAYGTNTYTDTNVVKGTTYNYCGTEIIQQSVASVSASATP